MQTLKTGESFSEAGYTITRIGAGAEDSENSWALFCIAQGDCPDCGSNTCQAKENSESCTCSKNHVHTWVKTGHSFSAGTRSCKLTSSNREESVLEPTDGSETGAGDC